MEDGRAGRTVPLVVDDRKELPEFRMTRLTYFTIESEPGLGGAGREEEKLWNLSNERFQVPFLLNSMSGVILGPVDGSGLFLTAASIEETFDRIEAQPSFYVDANDLWLPNFLFEKMPERGGVYRAGYPLFRQALYFRADMVDHDGFLDMCLELSAQLAYSEGETAAFQSWEAGQIEEAIKNYHDRPEMALKYREE